ncbi:MAG: caspase family protein, partial [Candidatus Angelobacter sp.]
VKLLTDEQATRDNIVGSLGEKWLRRLANSDDLVVIYMSSHGSAAKAEVGGANFIVPYEGNLSNLVFTGLPMQWFTAGLKDLVHCKRILLVLDVCHGGAVAPEDAKGIYRENGIDMEKVGAGTGQIVLASSLADQVSWESKHYNNGVFTRRLIEGLRKNGGTTTIGDAYGYMKDKIEEEVLRDRAEVQTPVLITHLWKGKELVLQTPAIDPRPGLAVSGTAGGAEDRPLAKTVSTLRSASSKELKPGIPTVTPAKRGNTRATH